MNVLITGHRQFKLATYDQDWIKLAIHDRLTVLQDSHGFLRGYAGMASGVDLWFCDACHVLSIPYVACIPFDEQAETMTVEDAVTRALLIDAAAEVRKVRNSWMVEQAAMALVVWSGDKGGTHNVVQQLVEHSKPFYWINPVARRVWECL